MSIAFAVLKLERRRINTPQRVIGSRNGQGGIGLREILEAHSFDLKKPFAGLLESVNKEGARLA